MTEPAPPAPAKAKQSSGRRRPGPNAAKSAGRNKNYASENDAAGVDPNFRPDFAVKSSGGGGGAPSTPRRKAQKNSGAAAQVKSPGPVPNQQPTSGKSNRRNKNGPKNAAAMAAGKQQNGHRTPPGKGIPIATQADGDGGQDNLISASAPSAASATQVFAGNSFHASPAASALPRPSFMQKSSAAAFASPESPRALPSCGLNPIQEPSPPASDSELPSATATTGGHLFSMGQKPVVQRDGDAPTDASPLDVLFRADRAEKTKDRRASAANIYSGVSPQHLFASPRVDATPDASGNYTFPRDASQQQHARRAAPHQRAPGSGISAAELDGNPGLPIGPAFATPFHERMRAVKPMDLRGTPSTSTGLTGGFTGLRNAGPGPQTGPPTGPQDSYLLTPPLPLQSPRDQSKAGPTDLEASLKRLLFSQPAASPGTAPPAMASPPRQQVPHAFPGYPGAVPFPGANGRANGTNAYSGPPSHNFQAPPHTQGQPFGHFDPRVQGAPPIYTGVAPGADIGNRNGANKADIEHSLRQILKLGSSSN